jgi:hypothetical protein
MSMTLIETKTITSGQTSIVFSGIPQNFTDLVLKLSARTVGGIYPQANCIVSINDSSNPYYRYLLGGGSGSGGSGQSSLAAMIWSVNANVTTANTFGNAELYIPNYTSTTNKIASADGVLENNATDSGLAITANKWDSSTAINTITLTTDSGNFAAGTTAYLYGISNKTLDISPKATGGSISLVGGYYVHTFTTSGTFRALENLSNVEYLVIAGGGGTNVTGGGGGAGGYRCSVVGESSGGGGSAESRLSLTAATNYVVTVGAGGSGGSTGTNGSNSVFSTITSTGGGAGQINGSVGGSGGGSYEQNAGAAGTANQGYAGSRQHPSFIGGGGGGGGAGQAGQQATLNLRGGIGGNGVASSINGTSTTRAAGGGGGGDAGGAAGGTGGGGTGGTYGLAGTAGTVNSGSGAGGGYSFAGNNGGSGIVIVRYLA